MTSTSCVLVATALISGTSILLAPSASAVVVSSQGAQSPRLIFSFSGFVVSQSRMWVPRRARLQVNLVDITSSNHSVTIASSTRVLRRSVPMPFHLGYHPVSIKPNHIYGLTATIKTARGSTIWHTQSPQTVQFDRRHQILGSPFVLGVSRG